MGCSELIFPGVTMGIARVDASKASEEEDEDDTRNRRRPFEKQGKWGIHDDSDSNHTSAFELVSMRVAAVVGCCVVLFCQSTLT
jgi:hypothetical protein